MQVYQNSISDYFYLYPYYLYSSVTACHPGDKLLMRCNVLAAVHHAISCSALRCIIQDTRLNFLRRSVTDHLPCSRNHVIFLVASPPI